MIALLPHLHELASSPDNLVTEVVRRYHNVESAKRDAHDLEELVFYWRKRTREIAQNPILLDELPDLFSAEWVPLIPLTGLVLKGPWDKRIIHAKSMFTTTRNPLSWVAFVGLDFITPLGVLLKCFDQFISQWRVAEFRKANLEVSQETIRNDCDIADLERETPVLDNKSVDWIRADKISKEKLLTLDVGTLRKYRLESQGGRQTEDKMFGIDKDGRIWRRQGTQTARCYYWKTTLCVKAT